MTYFHIDTDSQHRSQWDKFRIGERYRVGDAINPIYTRWKNSATTYQPGMMAGDVPISAAVMLRELTFENLRAKNYPQLPSRTSCIWLCDSEDSAIYWFDRIPHQGNKRILEIEVLDGCLFKTYEQHLTNKLENINELEVRAHQYWKGEGSGKQEVLFQGLFQVKKEIEIVNQASPPFNAL